MWEKAWTAGRPSPAVEAWLGNGTAYGRACYGGRNVILDSVVDWRPPVESQRRERERTPRAPGSGLVLSLVKCGRGKVLSVLELG